MVEITIPLPVELVQRIETLAKRDERTRPAEMRYLLRLALDVAEAERQFARGAMK